MPKNLPLRIPPGVVRPGTKYEAKGRWWDASLVRWHEGSMGPVGGWQPVERVDEVAVSAAISDDGAVFTDETADANNATTNDVVLVPASPQVNDAFYLGYTRRFIEVLIDVGTVATDGAVTWEYYNGTSWVSLSGVQDNTNSFKTTSSNTVRWTLPWDWATTTVNSQGPFYYVRARVTTAGTTTALGDQCWIADGPVDVDEPARGMIGWRANDGISTLAFGTASKLYTFRQGTLADITPASGFTAGTVDATSTSGDYGDGAYGSGAYGVGNPALAQIVEAQTWQLDTFGEDLIALAYSDGDLFYWDRSVGGLAAVIANAPTECRGVVVTPERFVVALGPSLTATVPTGAEKDRRTVIWSDQEDHTTWEPLETNQAGSFTLPGSGELMAGRRSRAETLLWTTNDCFAMRYIGGSFVYSFQQVGSQCGVASRMSMAVVGAQAYWMSRSKFFVYDGFVREIPSDVADYVFNDMNATQISKVSAVTLAAKNVVRWYYPSSGSTENDRYVEYNFLENHWNLGTLARTSGIDRDAFDYPIHGGPSGTLYEQERGTSYLDESGVALTPYAESGPIEIGDGDQTMAVVGVIPDETTLGDVQLKLYTSFYPTESETLSAAFTAREPTDVRLSARQVRLRVEQVSAGWRFGIPRLMVEAGGRR